MKIYDVKSCVFMKKAYLKCTHICIYTHIHGINKIKYNIHISNTAFLLSDHRYR